MKALTHKLRLLALRGVLTHPPMKGALGATLQQVQQAIPEQLKSDPKELIQTIGQPEILIPLLMLRNGLGQAEDNMSLLLPHLIASLKPNPPILWDAPVPILFSQDAVFTFDPKCRAMISDIAGVEIETHTGERTSLTVHPGQPRGWPLRDGLELAAVDTNPLRMQEAHPEKSGNAHSLGGKTVLEWQSQLNEALDLIRDTLPGFYQALPFALQRIVPVGFKAEMHLSASYREAPGTIYMTLHPSTLTLAEAIIHEVQHGKLNTLSWFDAVLHNAMTEWADSPVRPDLRPIWGVLLAVHAFVPVAVMHQRLIERQHPLTQTPSFALRRDEVLIGNDNGLQLVLDKGHPTALGQRVIDGLQHLHRWSLNRQPTLDKNSKGFILPPG